MIRALILTMLLAGGAQAGELSLGTGRGLDVFGSNDHEEDLRYGSLFIAQATRVGSWEYVLEGQYLNLRKGFMAGGTVGFRRPLVGPFFVSAGIGAAYLTSDLEQRTGLNFILQAGVGLRVRLSDRLRVGAEVRFHHLSTARLRRPNPGINAVVFMLGPVVTW